jgi:hypothetical protein
MELVVLLHFIAVGIRRSRDTELNIFDASSDIARTDGSNKIRRPFGSFGDCNAGWYAAGSQPERPFIIFVLAAPAALATSVWCPHQWALGRARGIP